METLFLYPTAKRNCSEICYQSLNLYIVVVMVQCCSGTEIGVYVPGLVYDKFPGMMGYQFNVVKKQ